MASEKPKVLLIDDEKFLLEIYSIKFLKSGFDVYAANSVDDGLAAIKNGYVPDAILFDITMPEKSGYEFLRGLATMKLPRHCVKVALTNEGQAGELHLMANLGTDLHLLKAQFTPAEIVEKVKEAMEKKRG